MPELRRPCRLILVQRSLINSATLFVDRGELYRKYVRVSRKTPAETIRWWIANQPEERVIYEALYFSSRLQSSSASIVLSALK